MDAVIVDMDGTAADVRTIRHHVTGAVHNFHKFYEESVNCPPNIEVIDAVKKAQSNGLKVLIVTARQDRYMYHTLFWLSGPEVDLSFDDIYMRKTNDNRPDHVVKREILERIYKDGYNPVHAWDDRPDIAAIWEEAGIPTTLVAGIGFED